MKLLTYAQFTWSAGLTHQRSNLLAMIREAALSGRDLLVPQFRLSGAHNRGRPLISQMDEYFDFANVSAKGYSVRLFKSAPADLREDGIFVARHESLIGRAEKMIVKEMSEVSLVKNTVGDGV